MAVAGGGISLRKKRCDDVSRLVLERRAARSARVTIRGRGLHLRRKNETPFPRREKWLYVLRGSSQIQSERGEEVASRLARISPPSMRQALSSATSSALLLRTYARTEDSSVNATTVSTTIARRLSRTFFYYGVCRRRLRLTPSRPRGSFVGVLRRRWWDTRTRCINRLCWMIGTTGGSPHQTIPLTVPSFEIRDSRFTLILTPITAHSSPYRRSYFLDDV